MMSLSTNPNSNVGRSSLRRTIALWSLAVAWTLNALLLIAAFTWTYCDGRSRHAIEWSERLIGVVPVDGQWIDAGSAVRESSIQVAFATIATFTVTWIVMACGLAFGPREFRSMRAWLLFMALACGWLGFSVSWPDVYWYGQQRRMAAVLAPVEQLATSLKENWPVEDGDLPGIGPYLAYPKGKPTTILPLRWIAFPTTALRFSAIEHARDGTIRFELTGPEAGAWLEWRPEDDAPTEYFSGLDVAYSVVRTQRLSPRWYLVRYRAH